MKSSEFLFTLVCLIFFSCAEETLVKSKSEVIFEATGDLDGDSSQLEKVTVSNLPNQKDTDFERELNIYRLVEGQWSLWQHSNHAVLSSGNLGKMF